MGRRRHKDLHLPKRMYARRGKYYFDSPATNKWEPLGDDYLAALAKYGQMTGVVKTCRTLNDVFRRYKTEVTPLPLRGRPRTKEALDNEIRTLDRFDRIFGHMLQDSLTQRHLYRYIDERVDDRKEFKHLNKAAPSAARHDVRFLKKVLIKGIRWGAGSANAAQGVELDADPKNERDVTPEEYTAVYALANERMQIAMDLATNIGHRRGDLLGIKPKRDFTPEGILIRQGKTQEPLIIEWSAELRATCDRAQALKPDIPREYLLRNRQGNGYTPRGFGSIWQKLMRKALRLGVIASRFKWHDLRAKAATDKADIEGEEAAKELLGHQDVKTTRGYIRHRKPKKARPVR